MQMNAAVQQRGREESHHASVKKLLETPNTDGLEFSEQEKMILELYDAEQELSLELALAETQINLACR